jgi:pheromone a factor receptor
MSIVQMFWGIAIMSIMMAFTLRSGLRPWVSWDDVHSDWLRIDVFPARFIPPQILFWTHLMWWSIPVSSLLFFIFFSFGQDAMKEYRQCITWLGDRTWKKFQRGGKSDKKKKLILPITNISKYVLLPPVVS